MAMSIRLDPATEALLNRLARRRKTTKSVIVRESLVAYGREAESPSRKGDRPIDHVRHLIGCVEGPGDLAANAKQRFGEIIRERHRARRTR